MPIIDMPVETLMQLVNRPAPRAGAARTVTADELIRLLPQIGCAVEGVARTHQYICKRCDKQFDRTEAQGAPLHCTHCGADFRADPALLGDRGPSEVIRLELLAVRPDIFDPGGLARLIRGYLEIEPGLREYAVAPAKLRLTVDPRLADEFSYRPFIACAVLRNVELDHTAIKVLMNLQEDLHWALGRDRKLASIGVYDLDTLQGAHFRYEAVDPDSLRFVPLGYSPDDPNSRLTPREILQKHRTGQAYAHLLASHRHYPLLRDESGNVLSMPPIINSEPTRVTLHSRQLFCDVTGLSRRSVDRALNVLVTSLKELLPAAQIEAVRIDGPDGAHATPNLAPASMQLEAIAATDMIGVPLDAQTLAGLLRRMGHDAKMLGAGRLDVRVPAYRNDVMHPVDLIEDAAIAYGYGNIKPSGAAAATVGRSREIEVQSALARRVFTGLGFHQVMTLVLTSEPAAWTRWRLPADPRSVRIENPISVEQTHCRTSLLPGLLETLSINKQYDLPQYLFEAGDCCFVDENVETGAREERYVAAAMIGTHVGYADIRAVADALAHELGAPVEIRAVEHPSLIPGRAARIHSADGRELGVMGELHPEVIENYGLKHAVAVLEVSLEKLVGGRADAARVG